MKYISILIKKQHACIMVRKDNRVEHEGNQNGRVLEGGDAGYERTEQV